VRVIAPEGIRQDFTGVGFVAEKQEKNKSRLGGVCELFLLTCPLQVYLKTPEKTGMQQIRRSLTLDVAVRNTDQLLGNDTLC
jgi:hypothetical protein